MIIKLIIKWIDDREEKRLNELKKRELIRLAEVIRRAGPPCEDIKRDYRIKNINME